MSSNQIKHHRFFRKVAEVLYDLAIPLFWMGVIWFLISQFSQLPEEAYRDMFGSGNSPLLYPLD